MEETVAVATSLRSLWITGGIIVGVIIWVYKLWYDTKENRTKIEELDKSQCKSITEIRAEHLKFEREVTAKIEDTRGELKEDLRELAATIKEFLDKHEAKELEEHRAMADKLEKISNMTMEIKLDLVNKQNRL